MIGRWAWAAGVALAVLAGCGPQGQKPAAPASEAASLEAQLDPCLDKDGAGKAFCATEALTAQAASVKGAFAEAAAKISVEGAKLLAQSQQDWVDAANATCLAEHKGDIVAPGFADCIKAKLDERAKAAQGAVQQIGGFTFQKVELSNAEATPAAMVASLGDAAPAAVTKDIAFPRIDNPNKDPVLDKFNAAVAKGERFKGEMGTSEATSYKIRFASPDFVSIQFDYYDMTVGAVGPNTGSDAITVNMKTGERLKAEDVFRAGSGWEGFLAKRALAGIAPQLVDAGVISRPREAAGIIPSAELSDAVRKPHLWALSDQGLLLMFPEGTFGGRALGSFEVTIAWADLKPFVNPAAAAPINPGPAQPG
ncbi:MAG: hypothetical protein ACOYJ6_01695 [Caulobacterales bacterium]|jgi:uncharacterized protein YecT (DUF1311 family)